MSESVCGFRLFRKRETVSTSTDAMAAAAAGLRGRAVFLAARQTGGRGRAGRVWQSPEGGLWASLLVPMEGRDQLSCLSLTGALAVLTALDAFLPPDRLRLKWPNDVLAGGKKISGVLAETAWQGMEPPDFAVIGIGINVAGPPPVGCSWPATTLEAEGAGGTPDEVLPRLLEGWNGWMSRCGREGSGAIRAAWLARGPSPGEILHVQGKTGRFVGLAGDGALILDTDGERHIPGGDVVPARNTAPGDVVPARNTAPGDAVPG